MKKEKNAADLNHSCECPNCFYLWESSEKKEDTLSISVEHCDYCKKHMPMDEYKRIERYFSIMSSTLAVRFAVMIPKLWQMIKPLIKEK